MAIKLMAELNTARYERKIGKYTLTRIFQIEDCSPEECIGLKYGAGVNPDGEPATDTVPGNVEIEHMSTLCDSAGGESDSESVKCYAIDRTAQNPGPMAGIDHTRMTVTYEGWIHQVLWWEKRILTASEQLQASIDATPLRIGPQNEGTSVFRPRIEFNIFENVSGAKLMFGGYENLIEELTGTVNEANWNPDVTEVNLTYPEGMWLYMGADITHHPGGNFSLVHRFLQIPYYCNCGIDWDASGPGEAHTYPGSGWPCFVPQMHLYKYREYAEYGSMSTDAILGTREIMRRKYGNLTQRKIYCIAGTDTFHDFGDMGL